MEEAATKNNSDDEPKLPSIATMKRAIFRDFDPQANDDKTVEAKETFLWIILLFPELPVIPSTGTPPSTYCFRTISVSHFPDSATKLHVPANTEAFCLIVWEGYSDL